jgi:Ca-activated chloride channel homolog
LPEGEYVPAIVILLTDGVTTTGTHPLLAAQMAAERGVQGVHHWIWHDQQHLPDELRRFIPLPNQDQFSQFFGGGGGMGGGFRREIDEDRSWRVAEMTGGSYYLAESSTELREVYENLPTTSSPSPRRRRSARCSRQLRRRW